MGFDLPSDLVPFDPGREAVNKNCTVRISDRDDRYGVEDLITSLEAPYLGSPTSPTAQYSGYQSPLFANRLVDTSLDIFYIRTIIFPTKTINKKEVTS